MTVNELLKALQELSNDGKGDYPIVGAQDEEGNGYRLLPLWVTEGRFVHDEGEFCDESTLVSELERERLERIMEGEDADDYDNSDYEQFVDAPKVICIG